MAFLSPPLAHFFWGFGVCLVVFASVGVSCQRLSFWRVARRESERRAILFLARERGDERRAMIAGSPVRVGVEGVGAGRGEGGWEGLHIYRKGARVGWERVARGWGVGKGVRAGWSMGRCGGGTGRKNINGPGASQPFFLSRSSPMARFRCFSEVHFLAPPLLRFAYVDGAGDGRRG